MFKFNIHTKDNKFYLTDNKINLLQFIFLIPIFVHLLFFKNKEYADIEIYIVWIAVIFMIVSIIVNITSYYRYKPLEGKIEHEIILDENEIIIRNEKIKIEEIKNIEITNDDFLDFIIPYARYIMIGRISHGVNNEIKITLNNNQMYHLYYQQDKYHDMQNAKELLKHYYSKGIITLKNLLYVLGIEENEEIISFKETLN